MGSQINISSTVSQTIIKIENHYFTETFYQMLLKDISDRPVDKNGMRIRSERLEKKLLMVRSNCIGKAQYATN